MPGCQLYQQIAIKCRVHVHTNEHTHTHTGTQVTSTRKKGEKEYQLFSYIRYKT